MGLYEDVMGEFKEPKQKKVSNDSPSQSEQQSNEQPYQSMAENFANDMQQGTPAPVNKVEKPKKEKKDNKEKESDLFWVPNQLVQSIIFLIVAALFLWFVCMCVGAAFSLAKDGRFYDDLWRMFR